MELSELSDSYVHFPKQVSDSIVTLARSSTDQVFINNACHLFEIVAQHLLDFANSIYRASSREISPNALKDVEGFLQGLEGGNLSFGHRIEGLRKLRTVIVGGDAAAEKALHSVLFSKDLGQPSIELVAAIEHIVSGRKAYAIPSHGIVRYASDKIKSGPNKKRDLVELFDAVVKVRNATAHRESSEDPSQGNAWFIHDEVFYKAILFWLGPCTVALFKWEPLVELLARYEYVTLGEELSKGTWRLERRQLTLPTPLEASLMLDPRHPGWTPVAGAEVIVERNGARSSRLAFVSTLSQFPMPRRSIQLVRESYIRAYLERIATNGLLDVRGREEILDVARQNGLSYEIADRLIASTRKLLEAWSDDAPAEFKHDPGSERLSESPLLAPIIRGAAAGLYFRRLEWIKREYLPNKYVISAPILSSGTDLSIDASCALLIALVREGKICALSDEDGPDLEARKWARDEVQQMVFRPEDGRTEATLSDLLNVFLIKNEAIPQHVMQLCELCVRLHREQGGMAQDSRVRFNEILKQLRSLREATDEKSVVTVASESAEQSLSVLVDGESILAGDVAELLARVVQSVRQRHALSQPVQFSPRRYVLNSTPVHVDNATPFAEPKHIEEVGFAETDLRGAQVYDAVSKICAAASAVFEAHGYEPAPIPQQAVPEDNRRDGSLVVEFESSGGETVCITGDNIPELYGKLLRRLVDAQLAPLSRLPVVFGRIRVMLDVEPYHLNGRRFLNPIEYKTYFAEANVSREYGLICAGRLLKEFGCTVLRAEDTRIRGKLEVDLHGSKVDGKDVPSFLTSLIRKLADAGLLTFKDLPLSRDLNNGSRYLVAKTPQHRTGAEFYSPRKVMVESQEVHIDCQIGRQEALDLAISLINLLTERREASPETRVLVG